MALACIITKATKLTQIPVIWYQKKYWLGFIQPGANTQNVTFEISYTSNLMGNQMVTSEIIRE